MLKYLWFLKILFHGQKRKKIYSLTHPILLITTCIHETHKIPPFPPILQMKSLLIRGFTNSIKWNWWIQTPKGRKCLKSLIYQQHIWKHIIDRQCYTLFSWSIGLDVVILWHKVWPREQPFVLLHNIHAIHYYHDIMVPPPFEAHSNNQEYRKQVLCAKIKFTIKCCYRMTILFCAAREYMKNNAAR